MGNEMGNNNTTGLKEEDHTTVEDPKGLPETARADDVKEENHILPAAEERDFLEKATGLASDEPERVGTDEQKPSKGEQEKDGVSSLLESPKVTVESGEAGGESNENQQVSLSNDAEDDSLIEPNMEERNSVKKEEEEMRNSTFDPVSTSSNDPEPQKPEHSECIQQELATVHVEASVPGDNGSSRGSEEVLGASLKCATMENDHLSDTEVSENLEASFATKSDIVIEKKTNESIAEEKEPQEEKKSCEDKPEPKDEEKIEYVHLSNSEAPENLEASFDARIVTERKTDVLLEEQKEFQEEKKFCEDKFEAKDGDKMESELSNVATPSTAPSDLGEKNGEGIPTGVSLHRDDCSESESESEAETISVTNSPDPHQELPEETEDKCMILTEETRLTGEELENGDIKLGYNPTQPCEDLVKESETEESNAFQSESIALEEKEAVNPWSDSVSNNDPLVKETKVAEHDELVIAGLNDNNYVPEENLQDSEGNIMIVPELGIIPSESNIEDYSSHKLEKSTEKRIVDETVENTEPLYAIEIETEETNPVLVDQAGTVLPSQPLLSFDQSDHEQESILRSETAQNDNQSIQEQKQDSSGESLPTRFDSTNLIAEIIASMNELAADRTKQDVKQCMERPEVTSYGPEVRQCVERLGTGSLERLSTDSDPDNMNNIHSQMRKSPSFNIDLRNEESESDQTPLLCQDKAPIQSSTSQDGVSLSNPLKLNGYEQDLTQYQAMPLPVEEEKVVRLERSDSEKSKTPFLGFLKEEEEAHIVVKPQKHGNGSAIQKETKVLLRSSSSKESTSSTSPKATKEKRKARSSLFGNCMCCGTVIN